MNKKHILIVEDDLEFQESLALALQDIFRLTFTESIQGAREQIENSQFDVFIVDLSLPDGSGLQLCSLVKTHPKLMNNRVLVLTGNHDTTALVASLELGAVDFLKKPVSIKELHARIEVCLRHQNLPEKLDIEAEQKGIFDIFRTRQRIFIREGSSRRDLQLTQVEFRILLALITHEGTLLNRAVLAEKINEKDMPSSHRSVDVHIHSIRKKLGKNSDLLRTVYGEGYLWESFAA